MLFAPPGIIPIYNRCLIDGLKEQIDLLPNLKS
jgi:hypothetical protein